MSPEQSFELRIARDNDAMQTPADVADALRDVARQIDRGATWGFVRDEYGVRAGEWELKS